MESQAPKTASSPMDFDPLIRKVNNEDPDIRFMILTDIGNMLTNSIPTILRSDTKRATQLVDAVVERLDDSNGDVQSQALKAVAPLASKLSDVPLKVFLDRLASGQTKNSMDDAIFITALRTVVTNLPRSNTTSNSRLVLEALDVITNSVLPKLSDTLLEPAGKTSKGAKPESIDLAHQLILCYGPSLAEKDKRHILSKLMALVDDSSASLIVHKRAVSALAALSTYLSDQTLRNDLFPSLLKRLQEAEQASRQMRMLLALIGSIAQASHGRIDPYLDRLVPYIFKVTSQENFDELTSVAQEEGANVQGEEVVEAALTALEELLSSCVQSMKPFTREAISSSTTFLTYDPNLISGDDDEAMDEDDDFAAEDDDFEDDGEMSDSDDASWKVRRCAAKVIHAIIRTRAGTDLLENGTLYESVAPVLVRRLTEREESVRLEIIAALSRLVRLTGEIVGSQEDVILSTSSDKTTSRKRRRRSSAAMFPVKFQNIDRGAVSPRETPSPTQGAPGDLANLGPNIAQAALNVLKQKQIASQQAATLLLRDLITARHGKLENLLVPIVDTTVQIARTTNVSQSNTSSGPSGSAAAATGVSLRIEAFRLLSAICDSHSSKALTAQVSDITSAVITAIEDKHFKIASDAVMTSESIIKVLTPPRSLGATDKARENIPRLYKVLHSQVQNSTEYELRTTAIHALGFLLSRTTGEVQLLGVKERREASAALLERLNNEVTRFATIEALECVASAAMGDNDYEPAWLQAVSLELANQLRKADRVLSATSLHTLNILLSHEIVTKAIEPSAGQALIQQLLPVLAVQSTTQLPLATSCIAKIIKSDSNITVGENVVQVVTNIAKTAISRNILDAYLELVEVIGTSKTADALLQRLLQEVGVNGSPEVTGAAIGTLMAAGGNQLTVKYTDIISELRSTNDNNRKALALSVLGQYGYSMGTSSPLSPDDFLTFLGHKTDVARAAAIALGRAGAGDPPKYLPVILDSLKAAGDKQTVLVPALREVLSYKNQAMGEITARADQIWAILINLSDSEGVQVVAAECIGKLVALIPEKFVPLLQERLHADSADARSLVNQALRYALSDSDRHLDDALRPVVGEMLVTLLRDTIVGNRRLALMTLSAAISNKPSLVQPHIPQLSQVVIESARVDEKLIRTVAMGPFKHKVDDGLETRKSAYETLHTLINTSYARLDSIGVFDRVVAGLGDDGDIKALCTLLVGKLLTVDREQSARYLHKYSAQFLATLSTKLKDTAVKQEIERQQEANKDVLRATAKVNVAFPASAAEVDAAVWQNWQAYMTAVRKDHANALAQAEAEVTAER